MKYKPLGNTGMEVSAVGFGALPLTRIDVASAVSILRSAQDAGINFFDTGRKYDDSEEKLGIAFSGGRREKIYIASKSYAMKREDIFRDIEESRRQLQTDYIDLWQIHNADVFPREESAIVLLDAREKGWINHIGITTHRFDVVLQVLGSTTFETVMFPMSYLATDLEILFTEQCAKKGIGFIAMKSLSGGLIKSAAAAYAFMASHDNMQAIWGIQKQEELNEFIKLEADGVTLNDELRLIIEKDREELRGNFCRGCGYCLPCPQGIPIEPANRMALFLERIPANKWLNETWRENMDKIKDCTNCRQCVERCPYKLNIPETLKHNLAVYDEYYAKAFSPYTSVRGPATVEVP